MPTSPRDIAWQTLSKWTALQDPPRLPEHDDAKWFQLPARDRGQAFDLISGIIRQRGLLDAVLNAFLKQPIATIEPAVRTALWIGAYQLLMQESAKPYAAVDEAVELCKRHGALRASGLVNAVLRNILRAQPRTLPRGPANASRYPHDERTDVVFNRPILPSPQAGVVAYLAAATSHPPEFVSMLLEHMPPAQAADILIAGNHRPAITLRADDPAFTPPAELKPSGVPPVGGSSSSPAYFVASEGWTPEVASLVQRGILSPQDPTAGLAAALLADALPNDARVCDLCAGLGTKTIQLARRNPTFKITASDIDPAKLEKLSRRLKETGVQNVEVIAADKLKGPFDAMLVDAPCSNSGVFARRVQARWRWPHLDITAMTNLQLGLLTQGAALLNPGGVIAYATCSIDPRENSAVVAQFRAASKANLVQEQSRVPAAAHDGGYVALLRFSV